MNASVNLESANQSQKAANQPRKFSELHSSRAISGTGLPSATADEIVNAITEALADVVKNDDLKHAVEGVEAKINGKINGLESTIKLYVNQLSKDDREYLVKFITDSVDKLRTDLSGRLDNLGERLDTANGRTDDVLAQLKTLSEALAASERRASDKREESVREMRLTVIWVVAVATALNVLANLFT